MSNAFGDIPLTKADLLAQQSEDDPRLDRDLNYVQSALIQGKLARGEVTPEQVAAWRRATATAPTPIPNTVSVPAAAVALQPGVQPGTTQPNGPRLADVVRRNFELTPDQQQQIARTGEVKTITPGDAGASVSESVA